MSKGRQNKRKRRGDGKPANAVEAETLSAWARLSKGSRALVALVATTAIAAVVPGVIPYVSDRVLDLLGRPVIDVASSLSTTDALFAAASEAIPEPPADPATDSRFVPAGHAEAGLTIEGKRTAGVTLVGISTEIVERKPIRSGTVYGIVKGGEGRNTVVSLDLDAPRPEPVEDGTPYFTANHISLAKGELALITLITTTKKCECAWRLHLTIRYRGGNQEIVIPPADEPPFRMTAFAKPTEYQVMHVTDDQTQTRPGVCADRPEICARIKLPS